MNRPLDAPPIDAPIDALTSALTGDMGPGASGSSASGSNGSSHRHGRATGTATRSSTSCTCARSPTATATAPATSTGSPIGSTTSSTSASTRSGCCRSTRRRCATTATTSPTTAASTRRTATWRSFKRFLAAAHARGLQVITELVINHTSDQHPWFQRARRAPRDSRHRDFYVWSDTPTATTTRGSSSRTSRRRTGRGTRWRSQYFWHRFYSHQPDLNFDNPDVRRRCSRSLDYWLGMGVDGVRLDAVPYLFERDGHELREPARDPRLPARLRAHMDEHFPGRMLLAEANQWPEDAVAYFGDGDECHMAFHFPVMPRLFMARADGEPHPDHRHPRTDARHPRRLPVGDVPAQPRRADARDGHRRGARLHVPRATPATRGCASTSASAAASAPLLQDDRRKIELLNALLFSLPGTPIVYYGDEIGMGDNVYLGDRDGVRTPMQWSADRNAGFSRATRSSCTCRSIIDPEYHYEALNVETQRANPASLLWWMRRLIALRKRHPVFGRGRMVMLDSDNTKVLSFLRTSTGLGLGFGDDREEDVLVVANLSRHVQAVTLTLPPGYDGVRPVELFGRTELEPIEGDRYRLTLGPHDFFWLRIGQRVPAGTLLTGEIPAVGFPMPRLPMPSSSADPAAAHSLASALPNFLVRQRWFGNHSRTITDVTVVDSVPMRPLDAVGVVAEVEFSTGEPQRYFVPIATGADGMGDPRVASRLVRMILGNERLPGTNGVLVGRLDDRVPEAMREARSLHPDVVRPLGAEQSNSSTVIDERAMLKVLRRVDPGIHPEVEILEHLTARRFPHAPTLYGTINHRSPGNLHPTSVATLTQFVPSDGDMSKLFRSEVARFVEHAAANPADPVVQPWGVGQLPEPLGEALHLVQLLGRRTAGLHRELASIVDERFVPVPFTRLYQRSLYQAMRSHTRATYAAISRSRHLLDRDVLATLPSEETVLGMFASLTTRLVECDRIRIHGDLHLAQVLERGGDVTFIDFEGEPARPIGERSIKRSALVDVAGMVRSFDYVAHQGMIDAVERGVGTADDLTVFAERWGAWAADAFVAAYVDEAQGDATAGAEITGDAHVHRLVPTDPADVELLLEAFVLQKAMSEVAYELDNRPHLVWLPLRALGRAAGGRQEPPLLDGIVPVGAAPIPG